MRTVVLASLVAVGLMGIVVADEIVLTSGVVLEGRATPEGDDAYRVDLDAGGRMTVPKRLVEEIRRDGRPVPVDARRPTPAPRPGPGAAPPVAPRSWSAPVVPPAPPPRPRVTYERQGVGLPPPCPPAPCAPAPCPPAPCAPAPCEPGKDPCEPCKGKLAPWFISLGAAYTQAGGNSDSLSFKFDLEVKYEKDPWTWLTKAFYVYGESGGVADTNRFFVESKLERRIAGCAYAFLLGSYDTDEPAELDHRIIGTLGGGYTFVKRENLEFKGEIGAGVTAEQRTGAEETVDPSAYLGLDYEQEFSWGGRIVAEYDFLPNLDDFDLSLMRFDGKFEVPLSACLNFRLGLRLDYQVKPKDPTVEKLDWIVSAGLSVNF